MVPWWATDVTGVTSVTCNKYVALQQAKNLDLTLYLFLYIFINFLCLIQIVSVLKIKWQHHYSKYTNNIGFHILDNLIIILFFSKLSESSGLPEAR